MALYFYPLSAKDKIGFNTILQTAAGFSMSEKGRNTILNLRPSTDPDEINLELNRTSEFKDILQFDDEFPLYTIPSLEHTFAKASIEGNYLTTEEFYILLNWLKSVKRVSNYLKQRQEKYPNLFELLEVSQFDVSFIHDIELIVGDDGKLKNNASTELIKIRKNIIETSGLLRGMLQQILREARHHGWADDKEPTFRNERMVIPIKSDFKGRIKGLVQDLSASGQTIYLEPIEALTLNNEVKELNIREKNEIIKILTKLTDKVRPLLNELHIFLEFITTIDVLRAKASLALKIRGIKPKFEPNNPILELVETRHPLLILQKNWEEVIPLDLKLDEKKRIIVISGPNAGGKSVALKCLGLCCMMLQSGFLLPLKESSNFRLFTGIFVDIGDDQSIQNDLSTYTSHLSIMCKMLKGLSKKSLFLIDEFGTGTDPKMGGAIAEALLKEFVKSKAFGVITTHYSNLKEFANKHENIGNAAMRFDLKSITPTYQLEQGLPGSSYAFDIAERVGIPPKIIAYAKTRVGDNRMEIERMLATLKEETEIVEKQKRIIDTEKVEIDKLKRITEATEKETKIKKNKILSETRQAVAQMIGQAGVKINSLIEEIKKEQAEKNTTLQVRKKLNNLLSDLNPENIKALEYEKGVDAETLGYKISEDTNIKIGDFVKFDNSYAIGKVVEISGKKCLLQVGELRTHAKLTSLVKILPNEIKTKEKVKFADSPKTNSYISAQKVAHTPRHLDLRGMRVEEAIDIVTKFIDDVILAGVEQATILHGKGTGALRTSLREYLRNSYGKQIQKMEDAPVDQGGSGITLIRFRSSL